VKVGSNLANIDTISDMGSALDGDSRTINMGVNDRERTEVFGIKLFGSFMVKNEAFITWLVIVMMVFLVGTLKIVIDDNLSTVL
jgi:hypothetical protein